MSKTGTTLTAKRVGDSVVVRIGNESTGTSTSLELEEAVAAATQIMTVVCEIRAEQSAKADAEKLLKGFGSGSV